jgi:DNA-binding NtrC family response regulator
MPASVVIVAQSERSASDELTQFLTGHSFQVVVSRSVAELKSALVRHDARAAVVDMEIASTEDVGWLTATAGHLTVICTHRSPDEKLWMSTLLAGAKECCHPSDRTVILKALRHRGRGARCAT